MSFSHYLEYNAVPAWEGYYINYEQLEDYIYSLRREVIDSKKDIDTNDIVGRFSINTHSPKQLDDRENAKGPKNSSPGYFKSQEPVHAELYELKELPLQKPNIMGDQQNSMLGGQMSALSNSGHFSKSSGHLTYIDARNAFVSCLKKEKLKIDDFYKQLEIELYAKFEILKRGLMQQGFCSLVEDSKWIMRRHLTHETNTKYFDESIDLHTSTASDLNNYYSDEELGNDYVALLPDSQNNSESPSRLDAKQSAVALYIDLCQLKSYIELNKLGFDKITEKFNNAMETKNGEDRVLSESFLNDSHVFSEETLNTLDEKINGLIDFYAGINGQFPNMRQVKHELKSYLLDHTARESRNAWEAKGKLSQTQIRDQYSNRHSENFNMEFFTFNLPEYLHFKPLMVTKILVPKLFFTTQTLKLTFIIVLTWFILTSSTFKDEAQQRCMALVECIAFLWASEAIPLHTTAILVPVLTVLFRVLKDSNGKVLEASSASRVVFSHMWSSTIMILLAGFTLGEALARYDIARIVASWLLAAAGTNPRNVLLMAMSVVFFLSMWISNVAAPVLTYSLISPLLAPLEASSPFAKALVMGIAFSADIGGMSSPISSPQNVISMQYLKNYGVGWGRFFVIALPSSILAMLLTWGVMCFTFEFHRTRLHEFVPIRASFTLKQYFVILVSLGTVLLWCLESKIKDTVGSSGIIAALPIVSFFGTGLLSTNDLNNFPWSIVILAMGGIALGDAVSSSGLLDTIAKELQSKIENDSLFIVLCIFGLLILVVGTFVSHTVSAIIIIPLVQEVGDKLRSPKAAPVLIFGCALLASCGMGLASSGFPNVTAISLTDGKGERYLSVSAFIMRGVPASLLAFLCVITLGYAMMVCII